MSKTTWTLKLVILGEPSVGKTSLRRSYLGEKFDTNYLSTIGADFSYKQIEIEEGKVNIAIWDLAGQILFRNVSPQYFRGAAGAMVVYDVTQEESYARVTDWVQKYVTQSDISNGPVLIIGNKTDLLSDEDEQKSSEQQIELTVKLKNDFPNVTQFMSIRTAAKSGRRRRS